MKSILLLFLTLMTFGLSAQQLERDVVASGSFTYADNEIIVTSTIGQSVVGSVFGANSALTQGFQQPAEEELSTGTFQLFNDYSADLYPNPAINQAYFRFSLPGYETLFLSMTDILGNVIVQEMAVSAEQVQRIPLAHCASGTYFVVLRTDDNRIASTHPLVIQK